MGKSTRTEAGATAEFRRDRHGNLRLSDYDATDVPWASDRKAKRLTRERRDMKYADRFLSV